jgi:predicted Zn-ribbon and HTH transcriptional regulator
LGGGRGESINPPATKLTHPLPVATSNRAELTYSNYFINMAVKIVRSISYLIKTRFGRKSNRYARLERSPSEEELENIQNERLESAIREGLKQGAVILVLPPPVCKKCGQQV